MSAIASKIVCPASLQAFETLLSFGCLFLFPGKTAGHSRSLQQSEHCPRPSCCEQLPQIILLPMVAYLCRCFFIAAAAELRLLRLRQEAAAARGGCRRRLQKLCQTSDAAAAATAAAAAAAEVAVRAEVGQADVSNFCDSNLSPAPSAFLLA